MTSKSTRRLLSAVGAAASLLVAAPREARACGSCRGPGGAGAALTAPWQRWGVSMAQSVRVGYGITNADAKYRAFGAQSFDTVLDVVGAAAMRPVSPIELGASAAFGNVLVGGPSFRSSRRALGDLSLRARYEALQEPPLELTGQSRLPSVGLTLTTRLPTGPVDRASDSGSGGPSPGTVGSTATSQGLGTTEVAFAVDVRKTFATRYQIGVVGEAAVRAADSSIGLRRALGPRGLVRAMGIVFLGDATLSAFADLAAEGAVSYGGRTSEGSGQRAFALGASGTLKLDSRLRSGVALSVQPPLSGLSVNAVTATAITVFLGFTK
ncbi:MAG: hypothetical protein KC657_27095 [Myxococcales bacterium]|nr:hypothetical protein [Myxococcales bacterium]